MQDYYKLLSVESSASTAEIRRAYRSLARKFHPDLNPGRESENFFKEISAAYNVLVDPVKRKRYDLELRASGSNSSSKQKSGKYRKGRTTKGSATHQRRQNQRATQFGQSDAHSSSSTRRSSTRSQTTQTHATDQKTTPEETSEQSNTSNRSLITRSFMRLLNYLSVGGSMSSAVSVVEISVTVREAVYGCKKVVELDDSKTKRRVSVNIPPGVRTGSIVHLKNKRGSDEDLIVVIRVAPHPYLSMQIKGLIVEIPVTIQEAVEGARIRVPTLEEPALISIPPGSQSGHEIRLRSRGPVQKDGSRGDIFYRLLIKVPEQPFAAGLSEKLKEVAAYYEEAVRKQLPVRIFS